jgi:hypothetical protein
MIGPEQEAPVVVARDLGRAEAIVLHGLLAAQGIPAELSQEAVGSVVAVDVGAFGQVALLVPASRAAEARRLLDDYAGDRLADGDDDHG